MLLVEAPVFFPSTCLCGEAYGRMVDTAVEKYEERLYLCERCVRDAGRLMSMVPSVDHDVVAGELDDARGVIVDLELQIAELVPVRDALIGAQARYGDVEADDEPVRKRPKAKAA